MSAFYNEPPDDDDYDFFLLQAVMVAFVVIGLVMVLMKFRHTF